MGKVLITATESKCAIHTQSRGSSLASKCTPSKWIKPYRQTIIITGREKI